MGYRLSELARRLDVPWEGPADPEIRGVAGFEEAGPGDLTFAVDRRREAGLAGTGASAVVARTGVPSPLPVLRAADPRAVFTQVLALFAPPLSRVFPEGRHPTAVVDPSARLAADVALGPYCVVGPGARIGEGCRLGPHVVVEADAVLGERCLLHAAAQVRERCVLGDEVILHGGAVVGSDGFGYHPGREGLVKIPQIGIVVLGDRVEIGANTCVDRATTGATRIGDGTKLDNMVQIAHNVDVGRHCAISAQCGISGSCRLGDGVTLGGQVGMADHLSLGDGVKVAAKSGITRDIPAGQSIFGYPAIEFRKGFKLVALTHRLPELFQRLAKLEAAQGRRGEGKDD
jgi:UDP-3-O-[3-hydroxymyristoyl] glucosamine N-acyltransferase